jgi:hypothetical protein
MTGREQQGKKRGEELLQGFFTGAVVVALGSGLGGLMMEERNQSPSLVRG